MTAALADTLRPTTDAVADLTQQQLLGRTVSALDRVVGALPVVGPVLGDDTLTTVTSPVTGLADDVLGDVGTVVRDVPTVVADPLPGVTVPGVTGPGTTVPGDVLPGTTAPPSVVAATPQGSGAAAAPTAAPPASPAPDGTVRATVVAAGTGASSAASVSATLDGRALLLPDGGSSAPDQQQTPVGGNAGGGLTGAGSAAPLGLAGTAGSAAAHLVVLRGPVPTDDAIPASVVGDHDVAPD